MVYQPHLSIPETLFYVVDNKVLIRLTFVDRDALTSHSIPGTGLSVELGPKRCLLSKHEGTEDEGSHQADIWGTEPGCSCFSEITPGTVLRVKGKKNWLDEYDIFL